MAVSAAVVSAMVRDSFCVGGGFSSEKTRIKPRWKKRYRHKKHKKKSKR